MGRPPILSPARLRQARTWAGQGLTHAEIGRKLGMSRSRISELIKQHGVLLTPGTLSGDADDTGADPAARDGGGTGPGQHAGTTGGESEQDTGGSDGAGTGGQGSGRSGDDRTGAEGDRDSGSWQVATRIESGTVACRYAGAMLVHAFTSRIGAQGLLRPSGRGVPADFKEPHILKKACQYALAGDARWLRQSGAEQLVRMSQCRSAAAASLSSQYKCHS